MKHVTIKDVAKALNVSISTISRAFNDKYDIHPDTKNMILEKAKEMGYSPNPIAQRLTQHKSSLIGVVVPEFVNAFSQKSLWPSKGSWTKTAIRFSSCPRKSQQAKN